MNLCEFHFKVRPADGEEAPPSEAGALPSLCSAYEVILEVDHSGSGEALDRAEGRMIGWPFRSSDRDYKLREALEVIHDGNCERDDLIFAGGQLWDVLVGAQGKIRQLFEKWRLSHSGDFHIRLTLPPELHDLPWETVYHREADKHLALDKRFTLIRSIEGHPKPELGVKPPDSPLNVLLVIPGGSRLDVTAEEARIREAIDGSGHSAQVKLFCMGNSVSLDSLRTRLREREWDVVHYMGHGGAGTVRLNRPGGIEEHMVAHDEFAQLFERARVRLALLNCCRGADSELPQGRKFGGLGHKLRNRGVASVIAMRYDILDESAKRFAGTFYHELLNVRDPGWVDRAFGAACDVVCGVDSRAPFTPAMYLARGMGHLFEFQPLSPPPRRIETASTRSDSLRSLVDAFRQNRCLVLAGPGILADPGQVRHLDEANRPRRVRDLAEMLAARSEYPGHAGGDKWWAAGGEAFVDLYFQWVCQHFLAQDRDDELMEELSRAYSNCICPETVRAIARWRVPAIIYTFIDGLLEQQATAPGAFPTLLLNGIPTRDQTACAHVLDNWRAANRGFFLPAPTGATAPERRLLVLARGSLREQETLRVTEQETEALLDEIGNMSDQIASFIKESPTRSLFILGADPSDPLVHRIARRVLAISGERRHFGSTFIACDSPTARDRNYWSRYKVRWISEPIEEVIRSISEVWP